MHDLTITGAVIVDGTGDARRGGDIGIDGGRITELGEVTERGRQTIDASGQVVSPGFIDVHTHLDVQGFWDSTLSPSPAHGVTTALAGNCGFSVQPLRADTAEYLMYMLARVEDIPIEAMRTRVPWDWQTTDEYLARVDGTLSINTGFMVGHSALRLAVMGHEACEREASDEELEQMATLLRDGLRAGAIGFSSTTSITHVDADDRPVPSRYASRHELITLAGVCREFPGTSLEFIPGLQGKTFGDGAVELMGDMARAAQRSLNWNVMFPDEKNLSVCLDKMKRSVEESVGGGSVVGLAMCGRPGEPFKIRLLNSINGLGPLMGLPDDELIAVLSRPSERAKIDAAIEVAEYNSIFSYWQNFVVDEAFTPNTKSYEGRLIGAIAAEEERKPIDVLCDIVIADRFETIFHLNQPEDTDADWDARATVWRTPGALLGGSDAGAHVSRLALFNYTTTVLQHAVREYGVLSLEEAVHHLTARPADFYGLVDRGRIAIGSHADLVLFDEATVGTGPARITPDLPGGDCRLLADATGISRVLVSGQEVVHDGSYTPARPGRVLRSGIDTRTRVATA